MSDNTEFIRYTREKGVASTDTFAAHFDSESRVREAAPAPAFARFCTTVTAYNSVVVVDVCRTYVSATQQKKDQPHGGERSTPLVILIILGGV